MTLYIGFSPFLSPAPGVNNSVDAVPRGVQDAQLQLDILYIDTPATIGIRGGHIGIMAFGVWHNQSASLWYTYTCMIIRIMIKFRWLMCRWIWSFTT